MLTLSNRTQMLTAAVLALLIVVTRGEHAATLHSLPGASWAVFFLAGVYLRPLWMLPTLFALVWAVDFLPLLANGASVSEIASGNQAFCLTPAYAFLLPAYGALWAAGRWYAQQHHFEWGTLLPLGAAGLLGAAVCELFSSGGFYFFSGRFAEPTFAEFGTRLVKYFPSFLQSFVFYVGITASLHALVGLASRARAAHKVSAAS